MKYENYSLENLRCFLRYDIEHVTDKETLFKAWSRLERQMMREPIAKEAESMCRNDLETVRAAIDRMKNKVCNIEALYRALAVLDEAYKQQALQ